MNIGVVESIPGPASADVIHRLQDNDDGEPISGRRAGFVRPLSVPHRILRALRNRERTLEELRREVDQDGHEPPTNVSLTVGLNKLLDRSLVVREVLMYGLVSDGERALQEADEMVREAVREVAQRQAALDAGSAVDVPVVHPHVGDARLATRGIVRQCSSAGDLAPAARRPGSERATEMPSRFGDRLHYRDGRVTDLEGNPIAS